MRQIIKTVFIRLGLNGLYYALRQPWERWKYQRDNAKFRAENPGIVLPPDEYLFETYKLHYREYWEDGHLAASEVLQDVERVSPGFFQQARTVLDWGCGVARLTRHLPDLLGPQHTVWGCDLHPGRVDWCRKNLVPIEFRVNSLDSLPYPDQSVDVIIGLSILTHLSEEHIKAWLQEIKRVMRPGGVAWITTAGESFLPVLVPMEQAEFSKQGFYIRVLGPEGGRTYASFVKTSLMREWMQQAGFQILGVEPGKQQPSHISQDIWLLQP